MSAKHSHYRKDVRHLDFIDVYRVLERFDVSDPCLQHAVKKLLVAGGRGGGKDKQRDVEEAIDSLTRWLEMRAEDAKEIGMSIDPQETENSAPPRMTRERIDEWRKKFRNAEDASELFDTAMDLLDELGANL